MKILSITKNINIKQRHPEFISKLSLDKVKNSIKHKQVSELAEAVTLQDLSCLYYLLASVDELVFANTLLNYCYFKYMYNLLLALKLDEMVIEPNMVISAHVCEFEEVIFKDYKSPHKNKVLDDFEFFNCNINKLVLENSLEDVTDEYVLNYFKDYVTSVKEIIRI